MFSYNTQLQRCFYCPVIKKLLHSGVIIIIIHFIFIFFNIIII